MAPSNSNMDSGSPEKHEKKAKRPRTIDDLYRQSTQYRLWSFTPQSLRDIKQRTNENGRQRAAEALNEALVHYQKTNPEDYKKYESELTAEKLLDLLTLEEEALYINFYCKNIMETANFFRMPTQVKATAVSFFRKFYLVHSTMEFHPKNVMYTCVFLAAKSENYFISIGSFTKALRNTEEKDILDLEFTVLEALHFTLLVQHAFRPLYGFYLDFQSVLLHPEPRIRGITSEKLASFYDKAKEWLMNKALLSDIPFLYTPPQVALAAAYATDKSITEEYLRLKFPDNLDIIKEESEQDSKEDISVKQEPEDTSVKKEPGTEGTSVEEAETETKEETETDSSESKPVTFAVLIETIKKCVDDAESVSQSTAEQSKPIDRKCYFALRPQKMIEKRIKKLNSS